MIICIFLFYIRHRIRVRLHPKPQLELKVNLPDSIPLFQPSRIRVDVNNLSLHYHRSIQYPFETLMIVSLIEGL